MVRMIFLHCFRTALLMLILTNAVSHAASDSLKTLQAEIDVNISWNINEGSTNKNGSLLMQITGTMELKPDSARTPRGQAPVPVILRYSLDGLTGYYNYQETITDNGELKKTYKGSGNLTAAQNGLMRLNRLKHIASAYINKLSPDKKQYLAQMPGQELLLDYYDFSCGFAAQPSKVSGKCRDNSPSGFSECKKNIGVGGMLLGFKIPDSGLMEGRRMWTARTVRNFSLSDLPLKMGRPAFKPAMVPGGGVYYDVTWAFGDAVLKPLDVEVYSVSFNYTDGSQDLDRSLELLHHAPEYPVESPEWVREGLNEPAAFVRNYPFKVKAVFDCRRPVKAAEIRAIETTVSGIAFGGELTQVGNLTITDKQISGEFVIDIPQHRIGTHKVRWQWEGDIEFKDEFGEIKANLGKTEHKIYIVGGIPAKNARAYKYATELGCKWAEGTMGGDETFERIWNNFSNIPAPPDCPSGGILAYVHKKEWKGTTDALLTNGMGKCGSWNDFFKDTVGIHGIEILKIGIYPKNAGTTVPGEFCFDTIVVNEMPAQGNPKPARVFTEHVLNKYHGIYYDPSYMKKFSGSLNAYENKMFYGYCRSQEVLVTVDQKDPNNKYHRCGKIDHNDPQQRQVLIAECLIRADDDGTSCVPNSNECEVYETSY